MWGFSYWMLPLVSAFVWAGMLIAMLAYYSAIGRPHLPSMDPGMTIPHISDVGAFTLKPLFITGSVITTILLDLAFLSERYLRHKGRLVKNTTKAEKVLSNTSLGFAFLGTAGLILLSIFDSYRYGTAHNIFLFCFMGGYILSAVFICWSYRRLGNIHREHRVLRISFYIKLVFIVIELACAIAFAVCLALTISNAGSVLEWSIAFIFTLYVASFAIDLRPAVHTRNKLYGRSARDSNATWGAEQAQFATTSNTNIPFGHGKSVYPGGFFPATNIEPFLATLLLEYGFMFADYLEERPPNLYVHDYAFPNIEHKVHFKLHEQNLNRKLSYS